MKIKLQCEQCKNYFEVVPSRQYVRKKGSYIKRKYCSVKCSTEALKVFWNSDEERLKRSSRQEGWKNSNWRGGLSLRGGYIYVNHPELHLHKHQGAVPRAVLTMEKSLNRKLNADEVVHHKNGVRTDDRIENLELIPNASIHAYIHGKQKDANHMEKMREAKRIS